MRRDESELLLAAIEVGSKFADQVFLSRFLRLQIMTQVQCGH